MNEAANVFFFSKTVAKFNEKPYAPEPDYIFRPYLEFMKINKYKINV